MGYKRAIYYLLKKRDGLTCGICGGDLSDEWQKLETWFSVPQGVKKPFKRGKANISIDHKIPKSVAKPWLHGQNIYTDKANLQLAHKRCNNLKGNSLISFIHAPPVDSRLA